MENDPVFTAVFSNPFFMLTRRTFLRLLSSGMVLVALPPLTGCSGGGDGSSADDNTTQPIGTGAETGQGIEGTPVSDTERLATLDAIETEFKRQLGTGTTFDPAAMVAFLKQQPFFHEVGYTTASACAWALFTDDRKLLIINNVDLDLPAAQAAAITAAAGTTGAAPQKTTQAATCAIFASQDDPLVTQDQFRLSAIGAVVSIGGNA
ncbi:MAG: hypothetical protein KKE17_03700 [Proteobacteria bacterium]|nr:hypothetical protein [Pseudomonadota bacterium]